MATRRWAALWAALFPAGYGYGYVTGVEPLVYLPAFALGALLAANVESLQAGAASLAARRWGTAARAGLSMLGPLLLLAHRLALPPHECRKGPPLAPG